MALFFLWELTMIELKILLDDIDYDALAEYLLPLVAEKLEDRGGILSLLGRNSDNLLPLARQMLSAMSPEKKDEILLQLLSEKKESLLRRANEKARREGVGVKIIDISGHKL